jgi:hypothetical protein
MKLAICQVADAGPLESLAVMLRSAGYEPHIPNDTLRHLLKCAGCDTVFDPKALTAGMGYDPVDFPEATPDDVSRCDLYVDIKAHRNGPKLWNVWPHFEGRTLWYRINGGKPEITAKGGDEVNLTIPILTPNLWYRDNDNWGGMAYACWPPFAKWEQYQTTRRLEKTAAICLIHNLKGWGLSEIAGILRDRLGSDGIRFYGAGSPDDVLQHSEVPELLRSAICLFSPKTSDCPGYSLYEALAAACPILLPRRLIERMRMEELFEHGETCVCFGDPYQTDWEGANAEACAQEILDSLEWLGALHENRRIGRAGRDRLRKLMWNEERDGDSFRAWMATHFPE